MRKRINQKRLLIGIVLICPALYCCVFPLLTGQACYDFVSGRVPTSAEERFLSRIFEDTANQEFEWVAKVSNDHAVERLKEVQSQVGPEYQVVFGDDLGGSYERRIKFESGLELYLVFLGAWSSCPDFNVTDEEITENMRLLRIQIEKK